MSSIAKRSDGTWRARFRDEDGKEPSRHFRRKVDAQRWLDEVTTAVVTGQYVDLRVRRQLSRATGGALVESPPKYGSERDVPVPDALLEAVARYVQEHRPGNQPTRWLLTEGGGAPLTQNIASDRWHRARCGAGVAGMRLHDLRHYFATGLIAAGVDVVAVQRALGHRSASVTLNTYSHLWPSAEDRTRAALAGLLDDLASAAPRAEDPADRLRTSQP